MLLADCRDMNLERPVAPLTAANYERSVRYFGEFLGRPATRSDLVERVINQWLATIAAVKSSATVLGHKRGVTVLWNWLADQNLVGPYDSRRLRRCTVSIAPPRSWSVDQVRALLEGAATMGQPCGHGTAGEMLRAWVLLGFESGLRPGDMRRLTPADVARDVISITQHKTGRPHTFTITPATRAALEPLLAAGNATVFPASKRQIEKWEARLFLASKPFGFSKQYRQGLGTLRKSNATEICRRDGVTAAARSLGHVSGVGIALRHYIAPDAVADIPKPPALL
jgi:integrase